MKAVLSRIFLKDFDKQSQKIKIGFVERKNLFLQDPRTPILNNHKLHGEFDGCRSINITGETRAIFYMHGDAAIFIRIGTHTELYE